jgi:type I restriction enzyme M protein
VVLFFEKGRPTKDIWYYQLNPGRTFGKTNPLNEKDLEDFISLQKNFSDSENSWKLSISAVPTDTFDLSVKNPNKKAEAALRQPQQILEEIKVLDEESANILKSILELI